MNTNAYIIEKVFVEVNTENMATATALKDHMSVLLEQRILPELEKILDEWNQPDKVVRFPTFHLDVQIPADHFEDRLAEAVTVQFAQQMKQVFGSGDGAGVPLQHGVDVPLQHDVAIISSEENRESLFFFFLEKGFLPWHGTKADLVAFLQLPNWKEHLERPSFLNRLVNLLKSNAVVGDRFIYQLEEKQKLIFLEKINPAVQQATAIASLLHKLPPEPRASLFRFLLDVSIGSEPALLQHTSRELENVLREKMAVLISTPSGTDKAFFPDMKGTGNRAEMPEIKESEQESFFAPKEEAIFVQNAGLFLLHHFLKSFFEAIEVLDEKGQIKGSARHVAIQSLHFLATGDCDFFECDLLFEKFLCGVPLMMPVIRESLLSETIKEECSQLLCEVIRQWTALKNSSPDGLRQLFIQRNGKLIREEHHYKLLMERKAQDILLDKLSWNSSLAKIPWRKELLFVEW